MLNEVAPPGFGHTKGDKKKGVEKGGTAAAFDRARKEGRFKGSKSDMFAIMWSQKNKGDKPHYKPGTDKKYKKYQEETNEYEKLKKKIGSKKMHKEPVVVGETVDYEGRAKESEKFHSFYKKNGISHFPLLFLHNLPFHQPLQVPCAFFYCQFFSLTFHIHLFLLDTSYISYQYQVCNVVCHLYFFVTTL